MYYLLVVSSQLLIDSVISLLIFSLTYISALTIFMQSIVVI